MVPAVSACGYMKTLPSRQKEDFLLVYLIGGLGSGFGSSVHGCNLCSLSSTAAIQSGGIFRVEHSSGGRSHAREPVNSGWSQSCGGDRADEKVADNDDK